jgi:tetratricopeptide (TPR) repeat protein
MKTIDFPHFIERYNAGEMDDAEKQWFLKEIEGNEKLKKEINLRKQTDEIIKNKNVMSLRNKLSKIEYQRKNAAEPLKKSKKPVYIGSAAVIAGLVIIGSITLFSGNNLTSEKIMKQYYKVYEPPTGQRSALAKADADFTLAMKFYNTHNYEKAAVLFNKVLEDKPGDMQTTLLKGVANFEQKKYPEAQLSFNKVIEDKSNLYIDHAKWYLALCYLNTNETEKARHIFIAISQESGIYKNDAKKIIRGLK